MTICTNCKHMRIHYNPLDELDTGTYVCGSSPLPPKTPAWIDPVTGLAPATWHDYAVSRYAPCSDINTTGNCAMFIERHSLLSRVMRMFA